jgi:hypothetical protein
MCTRSGVAQQCLEIMNDQAAKVHNLHSISIGLDQAATSIAKCKELCTPPIPGAPKAPPIHTAPVEVQAIFCRKLVSHLEEVAPFSFQAMEMINEMEFWAETEQTIPEDALIVWSKQCDLILLAIKHQATYTENQMFLSHAQLTSNIQDYQFSMLSQN